MSWRHPRSKHWHQLNLIITRRRFFQSFIITRTYHSADCDTDYSLVCCKIKLQPKKFYRTKQPRTAKVDVSKTRHPDKAASFSSSFDSLFKNIYGLPAAELWNNIKTATHSAAISAFGKKKGQQNNWYTENSEKLDPFVQAKRKASQAYKDRPTQANLSVLQSSRNQAKSKVRECVNDYWSISAVQLSKRQIQATLKPRMTVLRKQLAKPFLKVLHSSLSQEI